MDLYSDDRFILDLPPNRYQWTLDGSTHFTCRTRPNRFHRLMQRWILGVRWSEL